MQQTDCIPVLFPGHINNSFQLEIRQSLWHREHIENVYFCCGVESGAPTFDETKVPMDKRKVVKPEQLWQVQYFLMTTFIDGASLSIGHHCTEGQYITIRILFFTPQRAGLVFCSKNCGY